ncbi:histidine phosphatase family protein [Alteromonas sp. ASW11-19]|uniref:Histidine phosphatase family protein n=1 Tax=Alteromonas salexigens TaxID=2982530 RepID=A0ABT2VSC8_9ALTE|nr:histidine phosphatase family protein [Alteromonas salexigens]MCU7555812.1 histidine phosphatase family protein [Alteromonas salexigens]
MTELFFVRHGQASFGAADYDKLSELGIQQSRWLGEYFHRRDRGFDYAFCGNLRRHRETATAISEGLGHVPPMEFSDGLNEFDFQAVVTAYVTQHPQARPADGAPASEYYRLLKKSMQAWAADELDAQLLPESWLEFEDRAATVLQQLMQCQAERVLVVSSGGAIAMMLRHVLGYDPQTVIKMNLQIKNASFSQCLVSHSGVHLSSFNNVPHLDHPERVHAITYS